MAVNSAQFYVCSDNFPNLVLFFTFFVLHFLKIIGDRLQFTELYCGTVRGAVGSEKYATVRAYLVRRICVTKLN